MDVTIDARAQHLYETITEVVARLSFLDRITLISILRENQPWTEVAEPMREVFRSLARQVFP